MSFGNLGYQSSFACGRVNVASLEKGLNLTCPIGKLQRLVAVGLNKQTGQQVCSSQVNERQVAAITDTGEVRIIGQNGLKESDIKPSQKIHQYFIDFNKACSTYLNENMKKSKALTALATSFGKSCAGKEKCNVDVDYRGLDTTCAKEVLVRAYSSKYRTLTSKLNIQELKTDLNLPDDFFDNLRYVRNDKVPEPILYVVAQCDNQVLKIKGFDMEVTKSDLNLFLVFSDIVLTSILIIGFNIISFM